MQIDYLMSKVLFNMNCFMSLEKMHCSGFVFIFATWTLLGLASSEFRVPNRSARSAPSTITKRNEAHQSFSEFEGNLEALKEKLQSFKSEQEMSVKTGSNSDFHLSQSKTISRTRPSSRTVASTDMNTFFNIFTSLYSIYEPVLVDNLLQNLPQAVICVLADKQKCGWLADLTATLSSRLSGPVLSLMSSLKSQMCPSSSIASTRMANITLVQINAFQELVTAVLSSSLPLYLSDNLLLSWKSFIDLTLPPVVSFMSEVMVNFLQTFVDFLTIGLQIGVDVPSLDQTQQCEQGDLKQLVIWGLNHNMSWSFGDSILNMFLALDISSCDYTDIECQTMQLGRTSTPLVDNPTTQLTCDQQDVSNINDTLCADILANTSQVPNVLYGVCQALNTLSHSELIQVWRNACQMVQLVLSPLLEHCSPLPSESSQRVERSTLSLSQLFCNYENWTTVEAIDPGLVTMCSDNDPEAFLQGVCNNVLVMQTLIANPINAWVWEYCANASDRYMIMQYCNYETWTLQTIDPSIVALCWSNDQVRMETLLCQNLDFYIIVFSDEENTWLQPNCAAVPTTSPVDKLTLIAESCKYSEWHNIKRVTIDQISLCIQNDEIQFVSEVCTNSTFIAALVLNKGSAWIGEYCTFSINNPPTGPPPASPTTALTSSISATASSSDAPHSTINLSIFNSTLSPANIPVDLLAASITQSSTFLAFSSSSLLSVLTTISTTTSSSTTPLTFSSTGSIYSLSPTKVLTVFSMASSITPSPTTSLTFSSAGSILSVSPTKVLTLLPMASSIFLFPSVSPTISPTNSISLSNTSPLTTLPTVSRSSLSPSVPPTSSNVTHSLSFFSSIMTISGKIFASISSITLAAINPPTVLPTVSRTIFSVISPTVSSIGLSSTASPTAPPAVPSINNLCNYASWEVLPLDPSVVGLCWQLDMAAFNLNVCCNIPLFEHLILDPKNQWLKSVCSNNDTTDLVSRVCLYSDWSQPTIVDMTVLAVCADLDTANFTKRLCNNGTVLQNLLANFDNTWLLEQCSNLTGSGLGGSQGNLMGFLPSKECQYTSWAVTFPDAALLALCWDYDQTNFISAICINPNRLSHIIKEPSNLWVKTMCTTYSNYTSNTTQSGNTNSGSYNNTNTNNDSNPCLAKALIEGLNWSCSVDVNAACHADISQLQGLQVFFRCGVEVIMPRLQRTINPEVASMVRKVTNLWVVLLLILEENAVTQLRVTDNIRQSVLDSVSAFLERETNFDNKRVLLQCFGKVLTSLMQTERDLTIDGIFLIKQYFGIPLASLRAVLRSVDPNTMRMILQYFSRNQANLQLTDEYLRIMLNVLVQVQLRRDPTLFLDLSPLLSLATMDDIMSLPPLQNNVNILNFINSIINSLTFEQRQAFGWWFSQSVSKANITAGGLSFIRDNGNLITYLPFNSFQDLSPAQLLDGLDVLLRNDLGPLKLQFVAQSIIGGYKNLTASQLKRLGSLACQANLNDLLAYMGTDVFPVIQENIRTCVSQGVSVPSTMITSLFLNSSDVQSPASLSPQRISQLAQFLPLMGSDFLQQLNQMQLIPILSVLATVPFTPIQAAIIIDKVSSSLKLSEPDSGVVSKLSFLMSGVSVETLWNLSSNALLLALTNFSQYTTKLTPPQANAISNKLWSVPSVVTQLNEVEPLLSSTPLLCVIPHTRLLLTNGSAPYTRTWNTQQAKTLFKEAMSTIPNLSTKQFMTFGTIVQGVSCKVLTKLIQNNPTVSAMSDILGILKKQSVLLHPSLKKCLIEELYKFAFFSNLLGDMGSQIVLSIPMSTIKKFSVTMMDTLRNMIVQDPQYFLLMPNTKQYILVDKIVQRLEMHTGTYTEDEFRSLGIMATFVVDEVFMQLDRSFFMNNLEFLQGFCYDSSKRAIIASMLQESRTFGPVQNWTTTTVNQVDRFLFYLSKTTIQRIPPDLMTLERMERLFDSQRKWESGDVGSLCVQERSMLFSTQQFVLQNFLGFLKPGRTGSLIPTCESLHLTQPSAWPIGSLTDMSSTSFQRCLELIGQDPYFSSFQLSLLLRKTKEVYGAVSSFNTYVTAQLGNTATQLSVDELASLKLSDMRTVSTLGAVNSWTKKQLSVLFSAMLNSTKQSPSQLDSSTFVALGYIICGIDTAVIRSLNPVEFSKAALWLGRLNLSCSEDQLQAMITLLSHSLAFGTISSWGPEIFIEIGAFAAGIPDMAMSALVKEQIEGITPLAMSLIPPKKFAIIFNQAQISVFSYDQAAAITMAQRSSLNLVQETALSMVLNPLEDKPVDFRGRSFGVATKVCPLCQLCSLLVVLLMLLFILPL